MKALITRFNLINHCKLLNSGEFIEHYAGVYEHCGTFDIHVDRLNKRYRFFPGGNLSDGFSDWRDLSEVKHLLSESEIDFIWTEPTSKNTANST